MFDDQSITVSLNTEPVISKALSLMKGQRQTLIIPSDPTLMYLVSTHTHTHIFNFHQARNFNNVEKNKSDWLIDWLTGVWMVELTPISLLFPQIEDQMSKPEEGKNAVRSVDCKLDLVFSWHQMFPTWNDFVFLRFVSGFTEVLNITDLGSIEPSATSNYTLVSQGTWVTLNDIFRHYCIK